MAKTKLELKTPPTESLEEILATPLISEGEVKMIDSEQRKSFFDKFKDERNSKLVERIKTDVSDKTDVKSSMGLINEDYLMLIINKAVEDAIYKLKKELDAKR